VREGIYGAALAIFENSFGFGAGLGSGEILIDNQSYHSLFLEILAELGLPGLISFLLVFFLAIPGLLNGNSIEFKSVRRSLLSTIIALPFLTLGPSLCYGNLVFWLFLSLIICFSVDRNSDSRFITK
jgi:O-antigen ligase